MKMYIARLRNAGLMVLAATGLFGLNVSIVIAQKENPAGSKNDKTVYAALEKVPEKARAKPNPFQADPNAVAAGGKLFEQHCAECHGMKAEGTKRGPSLLKEQVKEATPGTIFWILTNGVVRHGMPVWSKLPEPERWQIVTFLKSFRASTHRQPSAVPHVVEQAPR